MSDHHHPHSGDRRDNSESVLERHFQTGISAIIIVLVIWFGMTTTESLETIARLDERVSWLTSEITGYRANATTHLSSQVADQKFAQLYTHIQTIELKIERLRMVKNGTN